MTRPMSIQLQAAMQVQSMVMNDTRDLLAQVVANPVAASAPATEHADVILTLSTAAQALTKG